MALQYFGSVVWNQPGLFDYGVIPHPPSPPLNGGGAVAKRTGVDKKYYLLGGKGGVGKTSCSSSLAVKFASQGERDTCHVITCHVIPLLTLRLPLLPVMSFPF